MAVVNDDLPMCLELDLGLLAQIGRFRFAGEKAFKDAYLESIIDI